MDATKSKPSGINKKSCSSRSGYYGTKRPHLWTTRKTVTAVDGTITESQNCSWCGVPKWTSTS